MRTYLQKKALWARKEALLLHKLAPEVRIASCLSPVEIFTVLYYGKTLRFSAKNPKWDKRDRLIISKGHGAVSLYPILADLGFFPKKQLDLICSDRGMLGSIPDAAIPGFETVNGSLGHGLGVASGLALGLKIKKNNSHVFVLSGDGELFEGSVWEAIMFCGHHRLDNLILIVDRNKRCMLDYCKNIIDLEPLDEKFRGFGWHAARCDGHDIPKLHKAISSLKATRSRKPKVLIADTVKGKGVQSLEDDPICHVRSLSPAEVERAIKDFQ